MTLAAFETAYWALEAEVNIPRFLQPENAVEQRQRFLQSLDAGSTENPVFQYAPSAPILAGIDERLAVLGHSLETFRDHPLYEAYGRLLSKLTRWIMLMRLPRSSPEFQARLTSIWGRPADQELTDARAFLRTTERPADPERTIPSGVLIERLRSAVLWASDGWVIEEDRNLSGKMSVSPLRKRIRVRAETVFSEAEVRRYLVHEIGVHVTRYENGARQPFLIFRHGFPQYLSTEEGLAAYAEEQAEVADIGTLRTYAGRLVAANAVATGSFLDVYDELVEWFDPPRAYEIVQRVKRGLGDTSQAGGYTKDLVYFRGYRSVKGHLSQGRDVIPLLVGKVGLQDRTLVDKMLSSEQILPPKHVPHYFQVAVSEPQ